MLLKLEWCMSKFCFCNLSSLEETYEALRTFEVLGIEKQPDIRAASCASVVDTLSSSSSALKDLFQALRVNGILKCELNKKALAVCLNLMNFSSILIDTSLNAYIHFSFASLALSLSRA